jgi:hypothetical protein
VGRVEDADRSVEASRDGDPDLRLQNARFGARAAPLSATHMPGILQGRSQSWRSVTD